MRVKICGITNPDDALAAAGCGADFVGLILAQSARQVTTETARAIVQALPPGTQPVLVMRDAPLERITLAAYYIGCDWVQLHGSEPIALLREMRAEFPQIRLIKAWQVSSLDAGDELIEYLDQAVEEDVRIEAVLLDAPKGGEHPGYDRLAEVAARCTQRPPEVWCAGALTPENVATVIVRGQYDGVDVASGVELRPGLKSHAAVRRFVEAAKGAGAGH